MIFIGTTGWEYPWWTGSFYPSDSNDLLSYFSKISSFAEINSAFMEIPSEELVQEWKIKTPDSFVFSAKMQKIITHNPEMKVDDQFIEEYFNRLGGLNKKLGMVLLQFPVKMQRSPSSQEFVFSVLDQCNNHFNNQLLIEFRNRSWHKEVVKDELDKRNACLVSTDKRPISAVARNQDIYYLRLLGDRNLVPSKEIGKLEISRDNDIKYWANHLEFLSKKHKLVYVAIDNQFSGNSAKAAISLSRELNRLKVDYKGFKVKSKAKPS